MVIPSYWWINVNNQCASLTPRPSRAPIQEWIWQLSSSFLAQEIRKLHKSIWVSCDLCRGVLFQVLKSYLVVMWQIVNEQSDWLTHFLSMVTQYSQDITRKLPDPPSGGCTWWSGHKTNSSYWLINVKYTVCNRSTLYHVLASYFDAHCICGGYSNGVIVETDQYLWQCHLISIH